MDTLSGSKKVISIVSAKSNMGKTTLIEGLIPIFKNKGCKIGVLKYDVKKFEIDREGKDSYRFTKAGADTMIIASQNKMAMIQNMEENHSIEDMISYFKNMDLIIVEGFKSNQYPQIEIHRKERGPELLYRNSNFDASNFIAVITDEPLMDLKIPQLKLNDIMKIAEFIEKKIMKDQAEY